MGSIMILAIALLASPSDLIRQTVFDAAAKPVVSKHARHESSVVFKFVNRGEVAEFELTDDAGAASPGASLALGQFVRCTRTDKWKPIHPRLIEILTKLARHFGKKRIDVMSGVRTPPYGAPHSKHFVGNAMDIVIPGVPARKVSDWVWHNFHGVGTGYYTKQQFSHIDVRELDVKWVDSCLHGESSHAKYTPRKKGEQLAKNAPTLKYDQALARAAAQPVVIPTTTALAVFPQ
jgi:uncharacterized protein YcbK (DUF882 family)